MTIKTTIATLDIRDLNVTTAKLQTSTSSADGVTNAKLADDAVSTAKIVALAVLEGKIGALAVTEGKIGALAVTETKIGDLAVSTRTIGLAAVTTAKIGDGQVKFANLETILDGVSAGQVTGLFHNPDITVDAKGRITNIVEGTVGELTAANFKWNQSLAGTVDSTDGTDGNGDFTIVTDVPSDLNTVRVYKNGLRQRSGAGNDYTIATALGVTTVTFLAGNHPLASDNIVVDYMMA